MSNGTAKIGDIIKAANIAVNMERERCAKLAAAAIRKGAPLTTDEIKAIDSYSSPPKAE